MSCVWRQTNTYTFIIIIPCLKHSQLLYSWLCVLSSIIKISAYTFQHNILGEIRILTGTNELQIPGHWHTHSDYREMLLIVWYYSKDASFVCLCCFDDFVACMICIVFYAFIPPNEGKRISTRNFDVDKCELRLCLRQLPATSMRCPVLLNAFDARPLATIEPTTTTTTLLAGFWVVFSLLPLWIPWRPEFGGN